MNEKTGYSRNKYSNVRRAIVVFGILIIVLLMVTLSLGMFSAKHMKKIISEDFNQQQLVVAKYAASGIEHCLNFITNELSLLNLSPSIQYLEEVSWGSRMHRTLAAIKDDGVLEIRLIEDGGKTAYVVDTRGIPRIVQGHFRDTEPFKWASLKENKNRIYMGEITKEHGDYPGKLVMIVATPTYEESVDAAYPVPTGRFAGVLLFTIDVTHLIKHAIKDIKSGKTGYAWVIDSSGVFLYHPKRDFIGEDAFKVRAAQKPEISFIEINRIQREKMLQGEEGTGSYISGWHGNIEGEMKKLIAYTPAYLNLGHPPVKWFWSVAVVAPVSEVEGTIHSVYIRQFYLQSIISLIIILGGMYIISSETRWAKTLEAEVINKTKDLKKSLDELKKSEEKYKTLVESAEDLIFTVDEDGKFLSLNRCAANFLRGREEDLIGKRIWDLFSAKSAELQMDFITQVFNTGRNINVKYPVEIGQREYWFTSNFVALKDERGEVFATLGISRDITERKKVEEEQMYNTEKLASLGKLAAGIAHEINTAVGIIAGFTDLVLEKIDPASKNHEILETIERQALNCKRIVENILGFARYPEISEYDTDVNLNLERVIAVVEHILVTRKITLVKHLAEDLPKVRGDSGHLQQVFMNLITNAFGAMEGGGVLTVTTRRNIPGNKVEILFKDTGHGIKREYRDKIFDPFFTTKKVGNGTGLGLSVSYGIVTKYEGDITFETVAEEEDRERKGTTFMVSLPVAPTGSKQISGET